MKTFVYLIIALIGVILGYLFTPLIIAYEQALSNKSKIKKHLEEKSKFDY